MKDRPITTLIFIWITCLCVFCAPILHAADPAPAPEVDRELKIIRSALEKGPGSDTRLDAAVVLLQRPDPAARRILLDTLQDAAQPDAAQAVCRSLINARSASDNLSGKDDFFDPLMALLARPEPATARLAAEALLIYDYPAVGGRLHEMARNPQLAPEIRGNAIHALHLWPGKETVAQLVTLLDDPQPKVAAAADEALRDTFGIPDGTDRQMLASLVRDLQRKKPMEIIRDLMVVQRTRAAAQKQQLDRVRSERDLWQAKYIALLDKDFAAADDAARAAMLLGRLASDLAPEKLWALSKLTTYSGPVPAELRDAILKTIADPDRTVRLTAAGVLSNKSALDPAAALLAQLQQEQDKSVALSLFRALGEACFFAFSPGSPIKLDAAMRDQTLALAADYVRSDEEPEAVAGAEVIRKLLELDGITEEKTAEYLNLLAQRYSAAADRKQTPRLRAQLLGEMARLSARSAHRKHVGDLYATLFVAGLADPSPFVREAAAAGMINIDRAKAYAAFHQRQMWKDENAAVRRHIIALAAELGSAADLDWLVSLIDSNGEAELAWQSFVALVKQQPAAVVADWAARLPAGPLAPQRRQELLLLAESKAQSQNDPQDLARVRDLLVGATLAAANAEQTAAVVARHLAAVADIAPDDLLAKRLAAYLAAAETTADLRNGLLDTLTRANGDPQAHPSWSALLKTWRQQYPAPATDPNAPPPATPPQSTLSAAQN